MMESRHSQAFFQCRTTTTDRHPVVDTTILNQTSRRVVMIRRRMSPTTSSKPRDLDHHQRLRSDLPNPASVSNWWMTFGDISKRLYTVCCRLVAVGVPNSAMAPHPCDKYRRRKGPSTTEAPWMPWKNLHRDFFACGAGPWMPWKNGQSALLCQCGSSTLEVGP